MTYTPPPPLPPPPPGQPSKDRVVLWGVLGIVLSICCCGLFGIVFGYLSMQEAKKAGKSPVLGYISMGLGVLGLVWNIIAGTRYASGEWKWNNQ